MIKQWHKYLHIYIYTLLERISLDVSQKSTHLFWISNLLPIIHIFFIFVNTKETLNFELNFNRFQFSNIYSFFSTN